MKLRRPCEHGRYERHHIIADNVDHIAAQVVPCPGGVFLPDDTIDLEALAAALANWEDWEPGDDGNDFIPILAAAYFALDALSVREAPEVDKNQMGMW